eukprot:39613-Eustigmatos_ZCMA.PRE.1
MVVRVNYQPSTCADMLVCSCLTCAQDGSGYHYHKVPCICTDDQGGLLEVHYNERTRCEMSADVYREKLPFEAAR